MTPRDLAEHYATLAVYRDDSPTVLALAAIAFALLAREER